MPSVDRVTRAACLSVFMVALSMAVLAACGSAAQTDQRLAARIAPTAGDLGPIWKQRSGVIRVPSSCPLPRATGCSFRAFSISRDPNAIPGTTAVAQLFPTRADAASAYTLTKTRLTAPQSINRGSIRATITLQSKASRAIGGSHATLFVDRIAMTAPKRVAGTQRTILIQEGRGEVLLIYKPGATVPFTATTRRLALRMQPAR